MARSFTYSALVLRVRPSGESNRDAWFLTAEEGILRATVFGGPKSRLRAHVASFHRGKLWVYHDPVRDSRKVTDFDVLSWRPGLRERYERSAAAAAVAETILASLGGGGGWPGALALADGALEALEGADEPLCRRVLIHFLWNWADILGLRPELNRCASCACEAPGDGVLWYSGREGVMLCPSCMVRAPGRTGPGGGPAEFENPGPLLPVGPGARSWLGRTADLAPSVLGRYTMDGASAREAALLVTELLAAALGKKLTTWEILTRY
jgi:DNA repair protein RecO (recombination protein O)